MVLVRHLGRVLQRPAMFGLRLARPSRVKIQQIEDEIIRMLGGQVVGLEPLRREYLDRATLEHIDDDAGIEQLTPYQSASRSGCCWAARSGKKSSLKRGPSKKKLSQVRSMGAMIRS